MPALRPIDARRARALPSYRDFVDDALFHPRWGYYSTGAVRFGEGGHYDTFPTALSPLFGEMVAAAARRAWIAAGRPRTFEVCEVGAGNGQLCCDVVATVATRADDPAWRAFARAFRYRVIERSPALVARQRAKLGPLAASVRWTRSDLSRRRGRLRLGRDGFVVANEVLDCLAHHKVVRGGDGRARVVFVEATAGGRPLDRRALGRVLAKDGARVRYREVALPLAAAPRLERFLAHYVPERLVMPRPCPPYFACPELPVLVRAVGRLYDRAETLWIDYGDLRPFHLRAPERRRVFAGPPRSNRRIYDAPGRDDITFMVDFTVAARAARDAGLACTYWGGQVGLVRASGVRIGHPRTVARIAQARVASWLLGVVGVGPERAWRQGGLTWTKRGAKGGGLETGIARDLDELLGKRPSRFRMLATSSGPTVFRASDRKRARRTGC